MGNQQNTGNRTSGSTAYGQTHSSTHYNTQPHSTYGHNPGQSQVYFPDGSQGNPAAPPGHVNPLLKYDTVPPVMASKHRQSWYDWMTGKPPLLTSPAELRDERYVSYIMSMHKIFLDYEHGVLTNQQALQYADHYMAKVREVGHVDDERTNAMLEQQGFTFQERADMQREYEDLRVRCGQKPAHFKGNTNSTQPGYFQGKKN